MYGALQGRLPGGVLGYFVAALLFWVAGLALSAVAVGIIAIAQRQFQVSAGHEFKRVGRESFGMNFPDFDDEAMPIKSGLRLRSVSVWIWAASVLAFVLGAIVAIFGLLCASGQTP
jgi:amino acid transporter